MAKTDKLKILFAASEAFPFAKSGGLGDVIGLTASVSEREEICFQYNPIDFFFREEC